MVSSLNNGHSNNYNIFLTILVPTNGVSSYTECSNCYHILSFKQDIPCLTMFAQTSAIFSETVCAIK